MQNCPRCGGTGQTMDHVAIGADLSHLRKKKLLSLREIARRMEINPSFLSDLEHGRRNWSAEKIEKFKKALKK